MTDAQYLFDSARQQYNDFAGGVERHFENVATQLKDWLPEQMRPRPPPPPRRLTPATYWNQVNRWVSDNTALSAGILAFVGTGAVLVFIRRTTHVKKRRARKSNGGARTEAVGMLEPYKCCGKEHTELMSQYLLVLRPRP